MDGADIRLVQIYLQPGEYHLARHPAILKTILGSCVGVTLWSPRLRLGALCHGVLPECPRDVAAEDAFRYVDFAVRDLVRQLSALGAYPQELQVKVFGGADVLPVAQGAIRRPTVGRQNCDAALKTLQEEGLAVLATDIGGQVGRTIRFHTGTGDVLVRRLSHPLPEKNQPHRRQRRTP